MFNVGYSLGNQNSNWEQLTSRSSPCFAPCSRWDQRLVSSVLSPNGTVLERMVTSILIYDSPRILLRSVSMTRERVNLWERHPLLGSVDNIPIFQLITTESNSFWFGHGAEVNRAHSEQTPKGSAFTVEVVALWPEKRTSFRWIVAGYHYVDKHETTSCYNSLQYHRAAIFKLRGSLTKLTGNAEKTTCIKRIVGLLQWNVLT